MRAVKLLMTIEFSLKKWNEWWALLRVVLKPWDLKTFLWNKWREEIDYLSLKLIGMSLTESIWIPLAPLRNSTSPMVPLGTARWSSQRSVFIIQPPVKISVRSVSWISWKLIATSTNTRSALLAHSHPAWRAQTRTTTIFSQPRCLNVKKVKKIWSIWKHSLTPG